MSNSTSPWQLPRRGACVFCSRAGGRIWGFTPRAGATLCRGRRMTALEALWPDQTRCWRPSWMERPGVCLQKTHSYFFQAVTGVLDAFSIHWVVFLKSPPRQGQRVKMWILPVGDKPSLWLARVVRAQVCAYCSVACNQC